MTAQAEVLTKRCSRCRRDVRRAGWTDHGWSLGAGNWCRACRNADDRARRAAKKNSDAPEGMKRCSSCLRIRPLDAFGALSLSLDRKASRCNECRPPRSEHLEATAPVGAPSKRQPAIVDTLLKRQRHRRDRIVAVMVYGGKCAVCESVEDLEFDHVNNDGKEHRKAESAAGMLRRVALTLERIAEFEIQLLCRTHHQEKTAADRRANRAAPIRADKTAGIDEPTRAGVHAHVHEEAR